MELYISRAGVVEGPHSVEKIQSMLREGLLAPADLGAVPGASDWSPLSELIDCPPRGEVVRSSPPPVPEPDTRFLDQQFRIDGKILSGTEGKSVRQIIDEVATGGRFVMYQFVFSIVVMSFRRNSPIAYIPPGRSGAGAAFGWSLISMCVGWWGFPWGIIFTIGALWRNTAGGVDVSEPILSQLIGPAQADALIRRRPKHPTGALWGLRALILSPLVLIPLLIVLVVSGDLERERERLKQPGYAELQRAERFVGNSSGTRGGGNTPAAIAEAMNCSEILQTFRTMVISDEKSGKPAKTKANITTWCETQSNRCLFIVEVPDLRRYSAEAKEAMGEAAWFSAQLSLKQLGLSDDAELAVAVRGSLLYDRLITGKPAADFNPESPDAEATMKRAIRNTKKSGVSNDEMIRYFVHP